MYSNAGDECWFLVFNFQWLGAVRRVSSTGGGGPWSPAHLGSKRTTGMAAESEAGKPLDCTPVSGYASVCKLEAGNPPDCTPESRYPSSL